MLFIAFNSAANLSGQALKNDGFEGLGFYTMATLYLVFAFCSFFSSALVNKMGAKLSLFVGGLCYSFWILCFLPPAFYQDHKDSDSFIFNRSFITFLSLFSAAINGFGAGVLWVAQGKFVGECASDANKGFFFGYFWAFFMASQILGNLIAALILGKLAQSTYYVVMSVAAFSGTSIFLLLRKPIPV
jgi:MFS family permease